MTVLEHEPQDYEVAPDGQNEYNPDGAEHEVVEQDDNETYRPQRIKYDSTFTYSTEKKLSDRQMIRLLQRVVYKLLPREQTILIQSFGLEDGYRHTLKEIAEELEVCVQRVHQLKTNALKKIGKMQEAKKLKTFL
jgi:DNA-directed RNA polymerase sigma subunit (sigma70/sigma32)